MLDFIVLFLTFWRTSVLFTIVAAPIYNPTSSAWGFPFLHIRTKLVICCVFDCNHSGRCEVVSHCGFDLHFLTISDAEHFFMCLLTFYYVFFGKMSIQVLYPFLKIELFNCFFILSSLYIYIYIYIYNIKSFYNIVDPWMMQGLGSMIVCVVKYLCTT